MAEKRLAPFVCTDKGHHDSIDREALLHFYNDLPPSIGNITSSSDLIGWELLRKQHGLTDVAAVPCDLFVWGIGQPSDQRLTRVGGTPWLPRSIPWPMIGKTVPSFLCQFDFRDSRDLVGELPGDILLVFIADSDTVLCGEREKMRFVWVSADETEIFTSADIPAPTHPYELMSTWGVRYRTEDLPNCWDRSFELSRTTPGGNGLWQLPVLWGTKIGGVPYHSQEIQRSRPKDFLCQLVSIQPSFNTIWPWVDHQEPISGFSSNKNEFMIGDMGEISFYLKDDGSIQIESSCG